MKPELEDKLKEKYPKIFSGRYGGLGIGDGWYSLLDALCGVIQQHIENRTDQRQYDIEYNEMVLAGRNGDISKLNETLEFMDAISRAARIDQILREELRLVDEEIKQVFAVQVKEKFGGLRFYINVGDDYINGAIMMAENMSYHICEECGAPGEPAGPGWILTLCEVHKKERQAKYAKECYISDELDDVLPAHEGEVNGE